MKKIILIIGFVIGTLTMSGQTLDNNRAGVKTEAKDTLFLLDSPMGHFVREGWDSITEKDLEVDGIKKKPVFVFVKTLEEFKELIARIEGDKCINILQ